MKWTEYSKTINSSTSRHLVNASNWSSRSIKNSFRWKLGLLSWVEGCKIGLVHTTLKKYRLLCKGWIKINYWMNHWIIWKKLLRGKSIIRINLILRLDLLGFLQVKILGRLILLSTNNQYLGFQRTRKDLHIIMETVSSPHPKTTIAIRSNGCPTSNPRVGSSYPLQGSKFKLVVVI